MRRSKSRAGFTMVEMAVVLVVVGILSSIAVVNYNKVRVHAEAAALSHDIHLLEDAVVAAVISGDITPTTQVAGLDALRGMLSDADQTAFFPRVPEGMRVSVGSVTGRGELRIFLIGQDRHKPILDALAAMRPSTADESSTGGLLVERIDLRRAEVEQVTPPAASGPDNTGTGGTGAGS